MEIKSNSFDVWMSHLPKGGAADKVWEPPVCVFEDNITRVLDLYNEVFFFFFYCSFFQKRVCYLYGHPTVAMNNTGLKRKGVRSVSGYRLITAERSFQYVHSDGW